MLWFDLLVIRLVLHLNNFCKAFAAGEHIDAVDVVHGVTFDDNDEKDDVYANGLLL